MNETFYHKFPNGIRLVHRRTKSEVAYVGIMVGAGTRNEKRYINGIAHYIEHCVFKGCKRQKKTGEWETISAKQIINKIEGLGGEINAYTTKEETTFYSACLKSCYERTLSLLMNMVFHPTFPKKETDKELTVIFDEIESYNDSPSELIYDDFESLLFEGDSLALPILGSKKSLRKITADKAKKFMANNYLPERIVIFTQGNLDFQKVVQSVEKNLPIIDKKSEHKSQLDDGSVVALSQHSKKYQKSVEFHRHTHQNHVMLGGLAYPLGHPKQLTLYLLNNILGGESLSSRLNMSLREQQGLVYTIESTYTPLSDTGYWCIYFACEPQYTEKCLDLIYKELEKLKESKLSASVLSRYKKQLRGQTAISAENQENNALSMAKMMLYHNCAPLWQETFAKIDKITAEELQEVAKEVFDISNIYTLQYK